MNRNGTIMLFLLAFFAILGLTATLVIGAQWDDISVISHQQEGDVTLVENSAFAVTLHAESANILWDLELPLAHPDKMTVKLAEEPAPPEVKSTLELSIYDSGGFHGQFGLDPDAFAWQKNAMGAVVSRTIPGETHSETLNLSDYDPYFSMDGYVSIPYQGEEIFGFRNQLIDEISAYLNLSTEGYQATISVTKNSAEVFTDVDYQLLDNLPKPTVLAQAIGSVGYVYVEHPSKNQGELHRIAFSADENQEPQLEDAQLLTTLPKDFHGNNFINDGENLLLQGPTGLYVYPLITGEGYFLKDYPPEPWNCFLQEDGLLLTLGNRFQQYTLQDGRYTLSFKNQFETPPEYWDCGYYCLGDQVYFLTTHNHWNNFLLQCISKDGRYFSGDYTLSYSQEIYGNYPETFSLLRSPSGPGQIVSRETS